MTKLDTKYLFYAEYHQNKWNKAVHYFCIPVLCWSLFVLLDTIPYQFDPYANTKNITSVAECVITLRPSIFLLVFYHLYYLYLNFSIGLLSFLFYTIVWFSSSTFFCQISHAWIYALSAHVISWIVQILGHRCCEGNQPAFMDSLIQSLLMAPLFVVYDFLILITCCKKPQKNTYTPPRFYYSDASESEVTVEKIPVETQYTSYSHLLD